MSSRKLNPGQAAPQSGQCEQTGLRGIRTGIERNTVSGILLPPTQQAGKRYRLVDPTNTKGW